MSVVKWAAFGLCVVVLCAMQGCAPQTDASDVSLDLSGRVLLEGEDDHSGVGVRVAFDDGALVGQAFSDAQGDFVFRNVPQQSFRLTFSKEGFDTQADVVAVFQGGGFVINEGQTVTLRPDRSASLSGQLDSPLSVEDWNASASITLSGNGPTVSVAPNGDGSFEVRDLRPGTYGFEVRAEGHLLYSTVVSLQTGQSFAFDKPIVLTPQAQDAAQVVVLRGRVNLEGAADSGGVQVRAEVGGALYDIAVTGADGSFVLRTSRLEHTLSFYKEGYRRAAGQPEDVTVRWVEDQVLGQGGRFEVDGEPVDGLVFDLEPLPVATMRGSVSSSRGELADWSSRGFVALVSQDQTRRRGEPVLDGEQGQGQFQFAALEPGVYALSVLVQGHLPVSQVVTLEQGDNVLETIEVISQDEDEDAQVVLSGRVCRGACDEGVDHSGILVRASVGVNPAGVAISERDGRFALRAAEDNHRLAFLADGYVNQDVDVLWSEVERGFFVGDQPLEDAAVNLFAVASASLSGQVVSSQGGRNDWPNIAFATLRGERTDRTVTVFNDDDGRGQFQFEAVPPGTYSLSISAQGHRFFAAQVALSEGGNALGDVLGSEAIELVVDTGAQAPVMRGRVLLQGEDPQDGDHSEIVVRARVEGNLVGTTLTDEAGVFAFDASAQNHTLSFSSLGYVEEIGVEVAWNEVLERFEVDGQPLEGYEGFALEPVAGQLRVNVSIEPEWIPAQQRVVRVRVVGQQVDRFDARVGHNAPVDFTGLPAGTYAVFAEREGFSSAQTLVTLDENNANVEVNLGVGLESLSAANLDLRTVALSDAELRALPSLRGADLAGVSFVPSQGEEVHLCGLDLSGVGLVGANFDGVNLVGASLSGANLSGASLIGANLTGADLSSAVFSGANLTGAEFQDPGDYLAAEACAEVELGETRFDNTDLSGANLTGALLTAQLEGFPAEPLSDAAALDCQALAPVQRTDLSRATFTQAILSQARLAGADLSGVDLSSAVLRGTDLREALLTDSALILTDMSDARLQCADLRGSSLLGSVLLRASFHSADLRQAAMTEAIVESTQLAHANLTDARAVGVLFAGANFTGAVMHRADLRNTDYIDGIFSDGAFAPNDEQEPVVADMTQARLQNANFSEGGLRGVILQEAVLRGADLTKTNLRDADLTGADLRGADLVGAFLIDADLTDAQIADATLQGNNAGRRAIYSIGTRWPDALPTPKVLTDPCFGQVNTGFEWPEGDDAPVIVPTQGHFIHPCVNLSGARRNVDQLEEEEILEEVRANTDLAGADLSDLDMRQIDLTAASLVGADLRGADLRVANMASSQLQGAIFDDGNGERRVRLAGADLRGVDLSGRDLSGYDLTGTRMRDANLTGVDFTGATLARATFQGADLTGALLGGALLDGAFFDGQTTLFPDGFDPVEAGMREEPQGFVRVEAGSFTFHGSGRWRGLPYNPEVHDPRVVVISRPFVIQETETTYTQWVDVMGVNDLFAFHARSSYRRPDRYLWDQLEDPDNPILVSMWAAMIYANTLSERESLEPCYNVDLIEYVDTLSSFPTLDNNLDFDRPERMIRSWDCEGYRLPTEMEWEYAARAGEQGDVFEDGSADDYGACEIDPPLGRIVPVKSFLPNEWGLYDVLGNASEWVMGADEATDMRLLDQNNIDPRSVPTNTQRCMKRGRVDVRDECSLRSGNTSNCTRIAGQGFGERHLGAVRLMRLVAVPD